MIKDKIGKAISVGDIVVFTGVGAGRNLPPLEFGEVVALTKAGVTLIELNNDFTRKQVDEMVEDRSVPPYWVGHNGKAYYRSKPTGNKIDISPKNVRDYGDRFYVVGRV